MSLRYASLLVQPISPADLAMKEHPGSPGAHAIILFKEISGDDGEAMETNYVRIKIFTEEGRKYGDVEIPYRKDVGNRTSRVWTN
ncbi:MAG: hypothetical protein ACRD2Y_12185 [Terriglobales bacterium]